MGRIIEGLSAKIFDGTAVDKAGNIVPDSRSVQTAIRGTLDNPALVNTNSALTLMSFARLDMFVPKRTTIPNSLEQFGGFPRPTLIDWTYTPTLVGNEVSILIQGQFNNKVGYDLFFNGVIIMMDRIDITQTFEVIIPAGATSFSKTLTFINDDFLTEENIFGQLTIYDFIPEVYNEYGYTFFFDIGNEPPTVNTFYLQRIASFSCSASNEGNVGEITWTQFGEIVVGSPITTSARPSAGIQYFKFGTSSGNYDKILEVTTVIACFDSNGDEVVCGVGQNPQTKQTVTAISFC